MTRTLHPRPRPPHACLSTQVTGANLPATDKGILLAADSQQGFNLVVLDRQGNVEDSRVCRCPRPPLPSLPRRGRPDL
jgi:hypothetical protein